MPQKALIMATAAVAAAAATAAAAAGNTGRNAPTTVVGVGRDFAYYCSSTGSGGVSDAAAVVTARKVAHLIRGGGGDSEGEETNSKTKSSSYRNSWRRTRKHKKKNNNKKRLDKCGATASSASTTSNNEDNIDINSTSNQSQQQKVETDKASPTHSVGPTKQNESTSRKRNDNGSDARKGNSDIVQEILRQSDYYAILGLDRTAAMTTTTPARIGKAYRRRCLQTHPDKTGGDRRAFDKVARAFEVLNDPVMRQRYDRYGTAGIDNAATNAHHGGAAAAAASSASSVEELFRSFFGGGGSAPFSSSPRRNPTVRYQVEVTLEDLYNGVSRSVSLASPFGEQSWVQQTKTVELHVPRGSLDGQAVVLSGEMDFAADRIPGDLVFLLRQRPHAVFTRRGHDLAVQLSISLQEALCGVQRTLRHLDGRSITIVSGTLQNDDNAASRTIIATGDVHVIHGLGMPKDGGGQAFGDLYVQYEVQMPQQTSKTLSLTTAERHELRRLLDKLEGMPQHSSASNTTTATSVASDYDGKHHPDAYILQPASLTDFGVASGQPRVPSYHEDDDAAFGAASSPFGTQAQRGAHFAWSGHYGDLSGGSSNFGGRAGVDDEEEGVQCRQM